MSSIEIQAQDGSENIARPGMQMFTKNELTIIGPQQIDGKFQLSKQRWLVLFAMAFYGIIISAVSEFRPIMSIMQELLNLSTTEYSYIKQTFMYLPALSAIPTGWFIDRYGLKATMYVATLFMLVGNGFRFLLFHPAYANWAELRIAYWIISGLAATQGAGIYFCTPLKISENWFGESERSVAWTVMVSAYNIGVGLATFSFPRFVHQVSDVTTLAYLNLISGLIVAIVIVFSITQSKPKYPPSERTIKSSKTNLPWFESIKRMLKQRDIMLHLVHDTLYESMTLSAHSVIQKILTKSGHTSEFVGEILSINSLLSVLMLIGLAFLVHRITNVTLTCKLASMIRTLMFILHLYSMLYRFSDGLVFAAAIAYAICKCWSLPNSNNMTAHLICGTVSEATISGVSVTLYTTISSICVVAFVKLMNKDQNGHGEDYTYSIAMTSIVCLLNSAIYIIFFKGRSASEYADNGHTHSITSSC